MAEPREAKPPAQHKYRFVAKKGSGAFSDVIMAECVRTGELVAIKRMKASFKSIEQITSLREIQSLRRLAGQPFIIRLNEILFDRNTGRLALVFELMEQNLYEVIKNRKARLPDGLVKWYMWQMLQAVRISHAAGYFHRDIKPENVLLDKYGNIKLADFGSSRGIYTAQPYTEYISTRWYRSPECLLTDGYYGPEMDIFGLGCVMFEIIALFPLFPGKDEADQIHRIHAVCGTPTKECLSYIRKGTKHNPIKGDFPPQRGTGIAHLIPHAPPSAIDLMTKMLEYDPRKRISAADCLKHPYFADILDIIAEHADTMIPGTLEKLGIDLHSREAQPDGERSPVFQASPHRSTRAVMPAVAERDSDAAPAAMGSPAEWGGIGERPSKTPPNAKRGAAEQAQDQLRAREQSLLRPLLQPVQPPLQPQVHQTQPYQPEQRDARDTRDIRDVEFAGHPQPRAQIQDPVVSKPNYVLPGRGHDLPPAKPRFAVPREAKDRQGNVPSLPSISRIPQASTHPSGVRTPPNAPPQVRQGQDAQTASTAPVAYGHKKYAKLYGKNSTYVSPYAQYAGQQLPGLQGSQYGALPPLQTRAFRPPAGGGSSPSQPLPGISGLAAVQGVAADARVGGAVGGGLPGHVARRAYPIRPVVKVGN